jgi:hypothetical protein
MRSPSLGLRSKHSKEQRRISSRQQIISDSSPFFGSLIQQPQRYRLHVPPKHRFVLNILYELISNNIEVFITSVLKYLKKYKYWFSQIVPEDGILHSPFDSQLFSCCFYFCSIKKRFMILFFVKLR